MIIEKIDGERGEWLTVTKQDEVVVGQRVRYICMAGKFGYTNGEVGDCSRFMVNEEMTNGYSVLFKNGMVKDDYTIIQAFYPIGKKEKKTPKAKNHIMPIGVSIEMMEFARPSDSDLWHWANNLTAMLKFGYCRKCGLTPSGCEREGCPSKKMK